MIELVAIASLTALATGLGAIPVFLLGQRAEAIRPMLLGVASGVMLVAAIAGLLLPALDEGSGLEVGAGVAIGVLFLLGARRWLKGRRAHGQELMSVSMRSSILVFGVLSVHSLPEGFAIGTAYASDTAGLALFVVVAISVQNIPEGTSVAIPMSAAGFSAGRQFWAAVLTSVPQPIGAVVAYLLVEEITALLPVSFGFAAGAMLALVLVELLPEGVRANPRLAVAGAALGGAGMLVLSWGLGV
jgi:ZIP family zinc transporter